MKKPNRPSHSDEALGDEESPHPSEIDKIKRIMEIAKVDMPNANGRVYPKSVVRKAMGAMSTINGYAQAPTDLPVGSLWLDTTNNEMMVTGPDGRFQALNMINMDIALKSPKIDLSDSPLQINHHGAPIPVDKVEFSKGTEDGRTTMKIEVDVPTEFANEIIKKTPTKPSGVLIVTKDFFLTEMRMQVGVHKAEIMYDDGDSLSYNVVLRTHALSLGTAYMTLASIEKMQRNYMIDGYKNWDLNIRIREAFGDEE